MKFNTREHEMKTRKIGLLGFGNIGKGVWDILDQQQDLIIQRTGERVEVNKILVRNKGKYLEKGLPEEKLTIRFSDITDDPEIEAVIELIGGIHPAYDYIREVIKKGKHVVTANKAGCSRVTHPSAAKAASTLNTPSKINCHLPVPCVSNLERVMHKLLFNVYFGCLCMLLANPEYSVLKLTPLDLHVLSTPPAFVLSQDQTL
jgi:hypothetical protein